MRGANLLFAFGEYPSSQPFSRKGRRASSDRPVTLRSSLLYEFSG
ncbi:hypothetical protein [Azospirillum doebereinerae]